MSRRTGFFRGAELPKLLVLLGVVIGGWTLLFTLGRTRLMARPDVEAGSPAAPIEAIRPDEAPEFAGVRDRTPMRLLDNAPLKLLLGRARELTPDQLAARSRGDILLTHLIERPEQYRGVPIHISGAALRVLTYEVAPSIAPQGRLYEAWIVTPDSQRLLYCCVFEDLPKGFPIGPKVSERVVFNGYFLKHLAYVAGDVPRFAPVLIGKVGWSGPSAGGGANVGLGPATTYTLIALGAFLVIGGIRWVFQIRRLVEVSKRTRTTAARTEPEAAPPADMGAWLKSLPDEDLDET